MWILEKKLRKQLERATILAICATVLFLFCGGALSAYLQRAKNETIQEQVIVEAEEYKTRILKQIDAGFQTLYTLAAFIGGDTEDREAMAGKLSEANQNNDFLTMVYYDREGRGVISTLGLEAVSDAQLTDISQEGREVVDAALEGTATVSQIFKSEISDNQVFVYGVPVFCEGEIVGALAASDHIDIFSDILSGNTVLGGGGYIHMLDSEGNFLVRSSRSIVKEPLASVYEGPYLSEASREVVRNAFLHQERVFLNFSYQGETYPFLLEPVGFNDWYLFCVNTGEGLASTSSSTTFVVQLTLSGVLILLVALMLYGYRVLRRYNMSLLQFAYFDELTGAENLSRFRQRLSLATEKAGGSVAALCVRQFPFINEIFGKAKASRLLCQVKTTAEQCLEEGEFFCRDTEDRFYLFFRTTDSDMLRVRLKGMMEEICRQSELSGYNYDLALYCGVALAEKNDHPEKTADEMMTHVLFALESARAAHGNYVHFFDTELHRQEEMENYVETHMQQALLNEEFKMYLQPKKNLHSGALEGAEALVRWQTGDGKMIFPDQFIPLFERNGFCARLDLYMMERVCRQLRSWMDQGIQPVPISVNQTKLLFFEPDYVRTLTELAEKYDIPTHLITFEILEGLALEHAGEFNEKILELQERGFRISLDDFGSGFSSLNTLNRLSINELKLDRGFLLNVSESDSHSRDRGVLILEQIIQLAGELGISTVAEGVETPEDEQMIREMGCDIGQGYLYSKPISAGEFTEKYMTHLSGNS